MRVGGHHDLAERPRFDGPVGDPPSRPSRKVEVMVEVEEGVDRPWRVILYNDEVHSFEEVIGQLVKALGCDHAHAQRLAWSAHVQGKADVKEGTFDECFRVQSVLREIELITEIRG